MLATLFMRGQNDRIVPPAASTVRLTAFTSAVMAFLSVFALALSLATGRLAHRWSQELAQTSTIRISAPSDQIELQIQAVEHVLSTTPGVGSARVLTEQEQRQLLEPWFGSDLPLDGLPFPILVEVIEERHGIDADGLRQRLAAEAPGAILDDHTRWRRPLVQAADRVRGLGLISLLLIVAATAAMITLAAQASLAANSRVIGVLRLVGAQDTYIARAFVRRLTLRTLAGATAGTAGGMIAITLLPEMDAAGSFLTGLGFRGWHWAWPLLVPPIAALTAFLATRSAASRMLKGLK